jgi:Astacin (Peptidase family M12A)
MHAQNSDFLDNHERRQVYEAMNEISKHTCIRFERRRSLLQRDFVEITNAHQGCFSGIGRQGGQMRLNLQRNGCMTKVGLYQSQNLF